MSMLSSRKYIAISTVETPLTHPLHLLGGDDRYKIDYSAVAVKSRCVTEIVNIACIINTL